MAERSDVPLAPRILIAGYYGSGNTGDEAILTALLQDMRARRAELEFTVVSADPADTSARHGVRSIPENDVPALIDAAHQCDAIVLGGGGIFHDYWGCSSDSVLTRDHAGISFYSGFPLLAGLTARPCMIYAAGVGPLFSEAGRQLTRAAFEGARIATVRDVASRELLHAIGVADVMVTADPAFTLRPDVEGAGAILSRLCPERGAPVVVVCLRSWMHDGPPGHWEEHVARALDAFIERTGAFVVFVPLQTLTTYFMTDDIAAADRVIGWMARTDRVASVRERHGPETVAGVLARGDLVVGMRLHSLVFAATAGVPAVALAYDPKVTSLMARLGVEDYTVALDAVAGLGERMSLAWARREMIRTALTIESAKLRELAAENARLAIGLLGGESARPARPSTLEWLRAFALQQTRNVAEQQTRVDELSARLSTGMEELAAVSAQADALAAQVETFTGSNTWRIAEALRRARGRLAPRGTRRRRVVDAALRSAVAIAQRGPATSLTDACSGVLRPRGIWAVEYRQESCATVTLYTDRADLFPPYRPRRPLSTAQGRRIEVSLVATTRNERASVPRWMASVAAQTRVPDEVVVVDAGSTDGTADCLEVEAARLGLHVRVLIEPHANIARGRNLAIAQARGTILAATDLGCQLTPTWLERIVAPFEDDPAMQVVAGWYVALERGRTKQRRRWPSLDQVEPDRFIPSSRSIAFTRQAWAAVGGYPEWLTLTGEDTWFALELRRFCERWAFVPEAVVEWNAPATMTAYWRKIHAWSVGDGESSVAAGGYWRSSRRIAGVAVCAAVAVGLAAAATLGAEPPWWMLASAGLAAAAVAAVIGRRWKSLGSLGAVAWESGAEVARGIGFLRGAARRPEITARRHRADRGMVFILSGVPIDDTGGGARCTQLALELLKQGWYVVFLSRFPRYESTNLGLSIRHPRLLTATLADFPWRRFIRDHATVFKERGVAAIVEFPLADFVPLARAIRDVGGSVVYDLLDNWDSVLGGEWYSPAVERQVIALSDVLIATAAPLMARLTTLSGREVTLVPNAVNTDLFDPARSWARPADYPSAPWSMIYIGALWGDWFDWELLRRLAFVYPEAAVVMIGDYRQRRISLPENVHFLGLKAQSELPAYLAHADVAIVPWKVNAVTHATSPLKVYEYLAMRRPVVTPQLDALTGIPGVLLSGDADAFVRNLARARRAPLDGVVIEAFVRENSWAVRVGILLGLVARANPRLTLGVPRSDEGLSSRAPEAALGATAIRVQGR